MRLSMGNRAAFLEATGKPAMQTQDSVLCTRASAQFAHIHLACQHQRGQAEAVETGPVSLGVRARAG